METATSIQDKPYDGDDDDDYHHHHHHHHPFTVSCDVTESLPCNSKILINYRVMLC